MRGKGQMRDRRENGQTSSRLDKMRKIEILFCLSLLSNSFDGGRVPMCNEATVEATISFFYH
jgi:hypothetical protein